MASEGGRGLPDPMSVASGIAGAHFRIRGDGYESDASSTMAGWDDEADPGEEGDLLLGMPAERGESPGVTVTVGADPHTLRKRRRQRRRERDEEETVFVVDYFHSMVPRGLNAKYTRRSREIAATRRARGYTGTSSLQAVGRRSAGRYAPLGGEEVTGKRARCVGVCRDLCCAPVLRIQWKQTIGIIVFLALLGSITALIGFSINVLTVVVLNSRDTLYDKISSQWVALLVWLLYAVFFSILAVASVRFISPAAAGSGLPEMTSLLDGFVLYRFLRWRTGIAKVFGLAAALCAGLSIGREGPYVHVAAIVVVLLLRFKPFRFLKEDNSLVIEFFVAAVAIGVVACFGAPIGGVLFSIEVTSSHYLVSNLPKSFYCSLVGFVFVRAIGDQTIYPEVISLFQTREVSIPYDSVEVVAFAVMGLVAGVLGAAFVVVVAKLVQLKRSVPTLNARPYLMVVVVAVATSLFSYGFRTWFDNDGQLTVDTLVSEPEIEGITSWELAIFAAGKIVFTAVSVVLPIPCGVFTPIYAIGAAYGRVAAEITNWLVPSVVAAPAGYALVGAASLTCGVTRSISTAIITLELTGQWHHLFPIFTATIIAYAVGNVLTASFYEVVLALKGTPSLPKLRREAYSRTASEIMRRDVVVVTPTDSLADVAEMLEEHDYTSFPCEDGDGLFAGAIYRGSLEEYVNAASKAAEPGAGNELGIQRVGETAPLIEAEAGASTLRFSRDRLESHNRAVGAEFDTLGSTTTAGSGGGGGGGGGVGNDDGDDDGDDDGGGFFSDGDSDLEPILSFPNEPDVDYDNPMAAVTGPELAARFLERRIDYNNPILQFDLAPFQIVPETPLQRLDWIFRTGGVNHVFVVDRGRIVGVITKKRLARIASIRG